MKIFIMAIALSFFAPHDEAIATIQSKPAVVREVFDGMLPELRARAFTVTGIQSADVLQRLRDEVASLPAGTTWDDAKADLIETLSPFLGDDAEQRAELLLRIHGFQAFQAATWNIAQKDGDTIALQYMTMEDDRVRPSHAALDGIIVPKNDPFWDRHFPPWEWGCRCRVRPMNVDLINEQKANDEKLPLNKRFVLDERRLDLLRNGKIDRLTDENGKEVETRFDVHPPRDKDPDAFQWNPADMSLPLEQIKERYDAEVWAVFESWAKQTEIEPGKTVWDWLSGNGGGA